MIINKLLKISISKHENIDLSLCNTKKIRLIPSKV